MFALHYVVIFQEKMHNNATLSHAGYIWFWLKHEVGSGVDWIQITSEVRGVSPIVAQGYISAHAAQHNMRFIILHKKQTFAEIKQNRFYRPFFIVHECLHTYSLLFWTNLVEKERLCCFLPLDKY